MKKQTALRLAQEQKQLAPPDPSGLYAPFGVVPSSESFPHAPVASSEANRPYVESPLPPPPPAMHYPRPQPTPQPHVSSFEASAQQAKSKLPHGLTVHELKEMTKARLQAEASKDKEMLSPAPVTSAGPLPPASFHSNNRARTHSAGAWSQDSRGAETWETGSVSTAASDYLGSESAFTGSYAEDHAPSPYNRGAPSFQNSFSSGPVNNFSDKPPESVAVSSFGYGLDDPSPNRRRAATMSPQHALSYLDERFPDRDAPPLPAFSSPKSMLYPSRPRSAYNVDRYGHGVIGGNVQSSRPRTSSATSLPAISHTAEEFSVDQAAFRRISSGIGTLREDAPSPSVTGLADVFRESPAYMSAPPGLEHANRPRVATVSGVAGLQPSISDSFADARGRAATWAGSSMDSMFGPDLIGHSSGDDQLSDDLAAILNLSVGTGDTSLYPPPGL